MQKVAHILFLLDPMWSSGNDWWCITFTTCSTSCVRTCVCAHIACTPHVVNGLLCKK